MAVTVNAGSSATFGIDAAASLTITNSGRDAVGVITFTSAAPDSGVPSFTAPIQEKVWGPFLAPMQVTIAVTNGTCSYQPNGNTGGFGYDTSGNITGLVDGAGNVWDPGISASPPVTFGTVAALKASGAPTKTHYETRGYYAVGDGGGNRFYWDAASTETVNDGTVIAVTGVATGRMIAANRYDVSARQFGLPTGGTGASDDLTLMSKMFASDAKVIRIPAGLYHSGIGNTVSNREIYFDQGAIIDGTIHLWQGTGPDDGGGAVTRVKNLNIHGIITSTCRVGGYYGENIKIPKIRITEIDAAYTGQTAAGGSRGVHIYMGTRDLDIGEILVDSTTVDGYALGIDHAATSDAEHWPTNVSIGKLTVKNNTQTGITTTRTQNLVIGEIDIQSYDGAIGAQFNYDTGLKIGRIKVNGASSTGTKDGIYVLNGVSADFGDIEVSGSTNIGFRTFNCARVGVSGRIKSTGNVVEGVRLQSPGVVAEIEASSNPAGVSILTGAAGLRVSRITAALNANTAVRVDCNDVSVDAIFASGATNGASGYGFYINASARFRNHYLDANSNVQGVRIQTSTDMRMGAMRIYSNTFGIVGSGMDGFSYDTIEFASNATYDSNVDLHLLANFRGRLHRAAVGAARGDVAATLTIGTDAQTQRWATPLTADRAVTLSTTKAMTGDKFRVVRTAAATGAFNLNVGTGPLKALTVGQWCDVEYSGSAWVLTAVGSL